MELVDETSNLCVFQVFSCYHESHDMYLQFQNPGNWQDFLHNCQGFSPFRCKPEVDTELNANVPTLFIHMPKQTPAEFDSVGGLKLASYSPSTGSIHRATGKKSYKLSQRWSSANGWDEMTRPSGWVKKH